MAALMWIWFKIFPGTHVSPSLVLVMFGQFGECRTFTLTAVVYLGNAHFTICWHDHSGVWWKHDGREYRSSPVVDVIHGELNLHQCDSW